KTAGPLVALRLAGYRPGHFPLGFFMADGLGGSAEGLQCRPGISCLADCLQPANAVRRIQPETFVLYWRIAHTSVAADSLAGIRDLQGPGQHGCRGPGFWYPAVNFRLLPDLPGHNPGHRS